MTRSMKNGSFIDWCKEYNVFGTDDEAAIEARLVPFHIYRNDILSVESPYLRMGVWRIEHSADHRSVLLIRYKGPIKGFEDTPPKEDFNRVKELSSE